MKFPERPKEFENPWFDKMDTWMAYTEKHVKVNRVALWIVIGASTVAAVAKLVIWAVS